MPFINKVFLLINIVGIICIFIGGYLIISYQSSLWGIFLSLFGGCLLLYIKNKKI